MSGPSAPNRWKRFDVWDDRPLRLDRSHALNVHSHFVAVKSAVPHMKGAAA